MEPARMANKRLAPILWFVAAALFAFAAVRDAFFPHFIASGNGHPVANAAFAVFFGIVAVDQLRKLQPPSPRSRRFITNRARA